MFGLLQTSDSDGAYEGNRDKVSFSSAQIFITKSQKVLKPPSMHLIGQIYRINQVYLKLLDP